MNKQEEAIGKKWNWRILQQIHKLILSSDKETNFHIFPLYIRYIKGDNAIAVLYFKGKFAGIDKIDLGLNLPTKPKVKGFKNADHMKYPGISYSHTFIESDKLTTTIVDIIKSI